MKLILSFLRDDDGTTAVEYAVMLALILTAIIGAVSQVGTGTNGLFGSYTTTANAIGMGS